MDNYSLFKHVCSDNAYSSLCKTLNSAYCSFETQKTIKRITKEEICYAHMGQLVIKDGICYTTFLQNPGEDGEDHDSMTNGVVLAIFDLDRIMSEDFEVNCDISFFLIGSKGDTCAGYTAKSIFKDNSMCLKGDLLHICFSFITEDDDSHIFSKTFDIKSRKWVSESKVQLRYNGELFDFSDSTMNKIYKENNLEPRANGLIELVSAWNEYKGEYYATGLTIEQPNNGLIVKTSDFNIMEFVAVVPFNDMGTAEIASYIYKDRLYVACRQDYAIPYLYLGALDLKTMKWEQHHKIADGNSRPWFFEYKNQLYLMHTVEETIRGYTNISLVRTWETDFAFFNEYHPIDTMATIKNCGFYFATAEYNGEIYFVATKDTLSFGKLCLKFYDEDEVNKKLLNIL